MIAKPGCAIWVCLALAATEAWASDPVDVAAALIGKPYVWGAEGPDAFDCSGLTQYVFQQFGIDLPRRAINQSEFGEPARRLRRGDLLFFASDARRSQVTHVGIYEGHGTMINASKRHGRVRRDGLDDDYWSSHFMFARRIEDNLQRADERGEPSDDRMEPSGQRRSGGREAAIRAMARIAEGVLRRAGRSR